MPFRLNNNSSSGGGGDVNYPVIYNKILTGPSNDLWMDSPYLNYEVLTDEHGNILAED